ncbi:NUDIX hydrolase [Streptomyces cyaneofuscatus]|uniref:NUDIX hydrolase n=1 Tax=Streptomyces cyaneofuscatus TaxID=66883 RepID=UPI00365B2CAA
MTTEVNPAVAAAVVVHDGRVLLVRRRVSEGALLWQFPAGKIESDETAREAAVLETCEETGLLVTPQIVLGQRVHPMTGREIHYIACRPYGGDVGIASVDEVAGLAWAAHGARRRAPPQGRILGALRRIAR